MARTSKRTSESSETVSASSQKRQKKRDDSVTPLYGWKLPKSMSKLSYNAGVGYHMKIIFNMSKN